MQTATFTVRRSLSGKTLKAWRKAHNLSAHALGVELEVSRSYIKGIEGGSHAASQKLIQRFNALRERMGEGAAVVEAPPKSINIICRYELPATIEILAKPRRCKGCHKYFIPITPNQKMHANANCQRAARRMRKSRGKRK